MSAANEATDYEAQARISKEQIAGVQEQLQHAETRVSSLTAEKDRLADELRSAQANLKASKAAS